MCVLWILQFTKNSLFWHLPGGHKHMNGSVTINVSPISGLMGYQNSSKENQPAKQRNELTNNKLPFYMTNWRFSLKRINIKKQPNRVVYHMGQGIQDWTK